MKKDIAYVQDKTISQIHAKSRVEEYLELWGVIDRSKVQELCGFSKDQAYRLLKKMVESGTLECSGTGNATKYHLKK